ncbi:MAG: apolipoprotein N-acyltransferase [Acidobacteriaceae bacterium]
MLCALCSVVSAVLLDLCFPVAGPQRSWQPLLAWIALVPLLFALLNDRAVAHPRYLRRAALTGYLCGLLWYILNCYWIDRTMHLYGHVPPLGSAAILVLFSAVLGLYFGVFGLILAVFRRRFGFAWALTLAPFLWTALDLAAARITSVPWDQLGYSQINNLWLTRLAPWTGVYGITFVLVAANAVIAPNWIAFKWTMWATPRRRISVWRESARVFALGVVAVLAFSWSAPPPSPTSAYAVLLQPNNNVESDQAWHGTRWNGSAAWLIQQSQLTCTPGAPPLSPASGDRVGEAGAPPSTTPGAPPLSAASSRTGWVNPTCSDNTPPPGVVLWPETASWFASNDPETLAAAAALAHAAHAPLILGMEGIDSTGIYNSALFVQPDGSVAGRYDKIHLVPFGEYVPYRSLFFFAHQLTHQLQDLQRGTRRIVFHADGPGAPGALGTSESHTFGAFICYESIFGNEVRHFARNGAQVLVNLSDDGWYGDTSAPWQHLDMTRMRAVENHRWLLLDTNSGVTTVIDPRGRVTLSAPRHTLTTLVARYGYETDLTFYTEHGDLFAWFCSAITILAILLCFRRANPLTR